MDNLKNNEGFKELIKNCENRVSLAELEEAAAETKFDIRMIPAYVKVFLINLKIRLMKFIKK